MSSPPSRFGGGSDALDALAVGLDVFEGLLDEFADLAVGRVDYLVEGVLVAGQSAVVRSAVGVGEFGELTGLFVESGLHVAVVDVHRRLLECFARCLEFFSAHAGEYTAGAEKRLRSLAVRVPVPRHQHFRCNLCGKDGFTDRADLESHVERRHPKADVHWWVVAEDSSTLQFED